MIPILDKLPRLSMEEYRRLHTKPLVPLDIQINIEQFEIEFEAYKSMLRRWGTRHQQYPRYAVSLYNLTGRLDDEVDPACWPLDQWWKEHPDQMYWDHDFNKPTEIMNLPSLRPLHPLQPHMIRSNILYWNKTGHLRPHVDIVPEYITHFRLWGTNVDSSKYILKYGEQQITDFEPGRIYLIDTILTHEAYAAADGVCTFFIAIDATSKSLIESLICT